MEQRAIESFVDFRAQAADVDVDYIRLRVEVITPYLFQQHRAGDHAPGVAHEVFQESELTRLKLDLLPVAGHLPGQEVHFEIGDGEGGFLTAAGSAAS